MKTAVYYNNNDIRIQEMPVPKIGEGEILVKVRASGICGTDLMEWYRIKKAPRILGHEISGEIAESRSDNFRAGQRVFVSHHVSCNKCKYCLEGNHTACESLHKGNYEPGGYSEFIRVPKENVDFGTYLLPDGMTFEEATIIEPLACAVRGQRITNVKQRHVVLVMGCGTSGLLNIQIAKLFGASVIATDINDYRLEKARYFGADETVNVTRNGVSAYNVKADRIIICTGAQAAFQQAFDCIDRKGVILLFAIPDGKIEVPAENFWRNEITLTSTYGASPTDLEEALNLIRDKKVNVKEMITHRLPLSEIQKGFKLAAEAKECLKVVLMP
jgi:L-iditol 2-dehydrogenase